MQEKIDIKDTFLMNSECTVYEALALKEKILNAINKNKDLEFDLSKVEQIDACIVQLLISAKAELEKRNHTFSIKGVSTNVQRFIANIHCSDILPMDCEGEQNG